jgi:hypothetical protein
MGQPNFSTFNKWEKVWVAGFLEKMHWSISQGQYCMKQLRDRPLHCVMVVRNVLQSFKTWRPLETYDNVECIRRQWVKVLLQKSVIEVWEVRKKRSQGNLPPVTELRQRLGKTLTGNLPESPKTTFLVLICQVLNGNNDKTISIQLETSCPDVRNREELIAFIENNCGPKEPYCVTAIYKCNMMQEELREECM